MPPVAAIAGGIGSAAAGAAGAVGGAVGGAGGLGGVLSGAGSLLSSVGGLGGGGGGGGADPLAQYAAQVQQAQLANRKRQKISDRYFNPLIGKRGRGKNTKYGRTRPLLFGQKKADVFGTRPEYYEVDFQTMLDQDPGLAGTARDVTQGNIDNLDVNTSLANSINGFLNEDARNRVSEFDPNLLGTMEETGRNALLASQGILPSSDLQQLVGGRNEMNALYGTAGSSRGQVARDLGLTQLDLQTRVAPQLAAQNANLINSFVPAALRADPRNSQVNTSQALQIGAADNQFEATFDRSEQNLRSLLESMPDPQAQGMFQLQNALRAQQFAIDFGLADGFGAPGTMPDGLGEGGALGFSSGVLQAGNALSSVGSLLGGSMRSPGF